MIDLLQDNEAVAIVTHEQLIQDNLGNNGLFHSKISQL